MISFRLREYGSADWTEVVVEGELEDEIAARLEDALGRVEGWHTQRFYESWENL